MMRLVHAHLMAAEEAIGRALGLARQEIEESTPEKAPAPDLVGELVEALQHATRSDHGHKPETCGACERAAEALARAKEQGR